LSGSGFKKQFTRADREWRGGLILGDEAENQTVKLKWMASKEQAIAQAELLKMTDELRQQQCF